MKGNNSLSWCEAQMIEAVETYLNEHVLQKPVKIDSVKYTNYIFEINIVEEEK